MTANSSSNFAESALYRRVWRWHFYAGLICLPFLTLMAITGALYLFKDPIEAAIYRQLQTVEVAATRVLIAHDLVNRALARQPGTPVRFVAPASTGRSAEVGVRTTQGIVAVYLDPADGRVLGTLRDDDRLMEIVKRIHSLMIAGPVGNYWVEVVAGWAIVLVVSGVFLWWPRGRSGAVYKLRESPAQRTWWRDLHATTGVTAGAAIVFLAVTGMPWSAFWGDQFGRVTSELNIGVPKHVWGPPPESSATPLAHLREVPWGVSKVPPPQSAPGPSPADTQASAAADIGLDRALSIFAGLGIPEGTPVRLPDGPLGVYTAMRFADDVRDVRVAHLDRYSGAVLADIRYGDYGIAARITEWGISIHTGRQFGAVNQLVMLAACLAIVMLAVSAAVMWWKRRPKGRLAAPPRRAGDRAARSALATATLLGLIYPLLGASMLVALVIDVLLPNDLRHRLGL